MTDNGPSKDLVSRLRQHAALHADLAQHSDEQAQWGDDLETAASEIERLHTTLAGIQSCSTCEACRGAATRALGDPLAAETRAATSRGAHSTEDAGRPRPSPEPGDGQ